ncbi:restriction endonuclease [Streptomyces sp. NPDC053750]|uniref:restriction endonuclease n=1 Tax=Streptomyces sp. NPDC053750 TaxID=3365714 RepID=UPI0037CE6A7A
MTVTERRSRPRRPGRRFDLRATAVLFGLVAVGLSIVGWIVRMASDVVERRPAWAVVLVLGAVVAGFVRRRRRSGYSAAGLARRTTEALEEATATTLEALEPQRASAPAGEEPGDEETTVPVLDHGSLSPDEFEQAIAGLCVRDGCAAVEVVGGAGDLGADVVATAPDGRRIVIQCKRYADGNKVGSEEMQRFGGTCFTVHEADVAILVTSSSFTAPAAEYAEQCGIVCVDERRLRNWSVGRGPVPWAVSPLAQGETEPLDPDLP